MKRPTGTSETQKRKDPNTLPLRPSESERTETRLHWWDTGEIRRNDRWHWILALSKDYDLLESGSHVNRKRPSWEAAEHLEAPAMRTSLPQPPPMRKPDQLLAKCRWDCISQGSWPLKPGQHTCQRQTVPHNYSDARWANCHCWK